MDKCPICGEFLDLDWSPCEVCKLCVKCCRCGDDDYDDDGFDDSGDYDDEKYFPDGEE